MFRNGNIMDSRPLPFPFPGGRNGNGNGYLNYTKDIAQRSENVNIVGHLMKLSDFKKRF